MRKFFLFYVLATALQIGCSKDQNTKAQALGPTLVDVLNEKEGQKILQEPVICVGNCLESVGAFYFFHSSKKEGEQQIQKVKLCSATLISGNKIITNKHCIQDLLKEGDDCSETKNIEIKFPATSGLPFQQAQCKKVLKTSTDLFVKDSAGQSSIRRLAPDWAIIELQAEMKGRRPARKAEVITNKEQAVQLYPVYFESSASGGLPVGKIKTVSCLQDFTNKTNIYSWKQGVSPLLSIKDCDHELIQGNSGSAIFLPSSNNMLGLMATTSSETLADGTQAHCFPDFINLQPPPTCQFDDEGDFEQIHKVASFLKKTLQVELQQFQDTATEGDSVFFYTGKPYHRGDLQNLKIQWRSPWREHVEKAKSLQHPRLALEVEEDFVKILMPHVPLCFQSDKIGKDSKLSFYHFSETDFNDYVIWRETGDRAQILFKNNQGIEVSIYQLPLKVQQNGKYFVISISQVPATFPFEQMEFRVPKCDRES